MKKGFLTYLFLTALWCLSLPDVQADSFDRVNVFVSNNRQSRFVEEKLTISLQKHDIDFRIYSIARPETDATDADFLKSFNVTIGTDAARYLLGRQINAPIYSVLLPEVSFHKLVKSSPDYTSRLRQGTLGAFFVDQPLERYLSLARMMGPDIMNIVLFQDVEQHEIDENKPITQSTEFNLMTHVLSGEKPSFSEIEDILSHCDLAIIRPGKYLNPFVSKWIIYAAYREKVPVISFSDNFLDAGSVASLSGDIEKTGVEIAARVIEILSNGVIEPGQQYSKYYSLKTNRSAARFLNILLPEKPVLD